MRTESFDPDVTPVDGTRATRPWSRLPGPGARPQPSAVRRLDGGRHKRAQEGGGRSRALTFALAGALVTLAALLIADLSDPSLFNGLRNISATPRAHHRPPPTGRVHHNVPPRGSGRGGPVLTAISPEVAHPGSTIELSGTGFFSANDRIVARVAGSPAPTRCPTAETCYVVLPAAPKGTAESSVQIVTEKGTSNSLEIRYG